MIAEQRAPVVFVFSDRAEEQLRAGRTLRALRAKGIDALDSAGASPTALAEHIDAQQGVWLVHAGAFPAHAGAISFPAPSATGKALCAFGAVRAIEGEAAGERADAWAGLLARTGGDLSHVADGDLPPLSSVYLGPGAGLELARRLADGSSIVAALATLAALPTLRHVRVPQLDVHDEDALRIALAITSLQQGGAERVVIDLQHALTALGVRARVITLGRPTRAAFAAPEGTVDVAALEGDLNARVDALARAATDHGADLIHAHLLSGAQLDRLARHDFPVAVTVHNTQQGWPQGLAQIQPHHASLLIACSLAAEVDLMAARLPIPSRTIWNGIHVERFQRAAKQDAAGNAFRRRHRIDPSDVVLLAVANPRPQKRLHLLPALLAGAQAALDRLRVPRRARLVLVGDVSPRTAPGALAADTLRKAIEREGVGPFVHLAGSMNDVGPALAAADALVSVSEHEGLSLAHLEALAAGLVVIATDAGGTRELANGNPAITVLPVDAAPEHVGAVAVERALSPSTGGNEAVLRDFTRERMAARHRPLYWRAIATKRARTPRRGVLLITNNFSTGGAQSSARRLLLGLSALGEHARAVVLEEQDAFPTPGRAALLRAGVPVLGLPPAGSLDPEEAIDQLLAHIDVDPPRAVIFWNALAEYKILLADRMLDIPIFDTSPGEMYFASLQRWLASGRPGLPYRDAKAYGARLAGVIVKYEAEASRARALLGAPVHVIANGVDLGPRPRARAPGARLVIGTAARLSPQKKLDQLLAALRRAHGDLPPYVLRIAGGPERGAPDHARELRDLARGLPVEWLGDVGDTAAMLAELDLFAMISEPAGCPNASLEAMAAGLAVVATDVGGASEQVVDGVTGRLLARDDVDAIAAALVELGADPARRSAFGAAGRARAEARFDVHRMVHDYRKILLG